MRVHRPTDAFQLSRAAAVCAICGMAISLSSCINQNNTRFPTVFNYGPEYERDQAAVQDPYPDSIAGPDAGFRPNEFVQERSEPTRARHRLIATRMREEYQRNNPGAAPPLFAPTTMYPYPGVVPPATAVTPYPPYPPPPPGPPTIVPMGPTASGPYWMPYSPPVVVRPIFLPQMSVNFVVPFR